MSFSAWDQERLGILLNKNAVKNIILAGLEAHICVLQTALDLVEQGFNVYVPVDAISARRSIDKKWAIARLLRQEVIISTTEAIIFEICKTADRQEFKKLSMIIKQ